MFLLFHYLCFDEYRIKAKCVCALEHVFTSRHYISEFDCVEKRLEISQRRRFDRLETILPIIRYFCLQARFTLAIRESIVFTTIPSSINLSAIITQTLDSSPTRHFIVPRSIFKRRRLSRRVCSDTMCVVCVVCVHVYMYVYIYTYIYIHI